MANKKCLQRSTCEKIAKRRTALPTVRWTDRELCDTCPLSLEKPVERSQPKFQEKVVVK